MTAEELIGFLVVGGTVVEFLHVAIGFAFLATAWYFFQFLSFETQEEKNEKEENAKKSEKDFKKWNKKRKKTKKKKDELEMRKKYLMIAKRKLLEVIALCRELRTEVLSKKKDDSTTNEAKSLSSRIRNKLQEARRNVRVSHRLTRDPINKALSAVHTLCDHALEFYVKHCHKKIPKATANRYRRKVTTLQANIKKVEDYCAYIVREIDNFIKKSNEITVRDMDGEETVPPGNNRSGSDNDTDDGNNGRDGTDGADDRNGTNSRNGRNGNDETNGTNDSRARNTNRPGRPAAIVRRRPANNRRGED